MNDWQGGVEQPYTATTLPMIDPMTDEHNGRHRAIVTGAPMTLWDGSTAPSRASGPVFDTEQEALDEAARYIASLDDGQLDFSAIDPLMDAVHAERADRRHTREESA